MYDYRYCFQNGQEVLIPVFFWILQSTKYFQRGQYNHVKRHRFYSSFPVWWFCTSLATIYHEGVFRWWQYSKQKFFTIKNSFGTFKACFRYLQRAMDINTSTSFIFLLSITQQFWNIEEGNSRTEPWLNMNLEKRAKPATSSLSFKRVLNEKKVTDIRNILTLFFE